MRPASEPSSYVTNYLHVQLYDGLDTSVRRPLQTLPVTIVDHSGPAHRCYYLYVHTHSLIMVALCNRADHYIFALWFLSFFLFSTPNLSGRRLDVYHTSTHGVALAQI